MEEYTESNYYFIRLILKWKKHFLIITGIALFASVLFSAEWFIKPKYKSFAIIYPSNIIPYGDESASEQMLQLLGASDIRTAVMRKFDLSKHYDIDTTQKSGRTRLNKAYDANVTVSRTEFESIEITVLDTDPKVASEMVKEVINALNLKARKLQRDKTQEVLNMFSNQLQFKKKQVDSVSAAIQELTVKYQLLDYEVQVKEVTKSYLKALSSGTRKENLKDLDVMMRNLEEKGGEYFELTKTFDVVLSSYNNTKLEYDNTLKDLKKELTYTNEITRPIVADTKSYPVRWLIVLASVVSVNFFLFLLLLVLDIRKKVI